MYESENKSSSSIYLDSKKRLSQLIQILFEEEIFLEDGVYSAINQLKGKKINMLFENYPVFIQQNNLENLFYGTTKLPNISIQEVQFALTLASVESLILCSKKIFHQQNTELLIFETDSIDLQILNYIIQSIHLKDLQYQLIIILNIIIDSNLLIPFTSKDNTSTVTASYSLIYWFTTTNLLLETLYDWRENSEI